MSSIAFTTLNGTDLQEARVRGVERHLAGRFVSDSLLTATGWNNDYGPSEHCRWILEILPQDCYVRDHFDRHDFFRILRCWLAVGSGEPWLKVGDQRPTVFQLQLNTLLAIGSDPMRLMARLHGQCEIHAFVEGPNRAWLAGIIQEGRQTGVMREQCGWEAVMELLRQADDQPVVTSYSVTDSFPNPGPRKLSEAQHEKWWEKPAVKQWDEAIKWLRKANQGTIEMHPERWRYPDYFFGPQLNGFDIKPLTPDQPNHPRG